MSTDKNKKESLKINKTLSFTEKDRPLVEKLDSLGYFDKSFNFNDYIKKLIEKDISTPKEVFTDSQITEIKNIVLSLLKNENIDLSIIKNELTATLSDFDLALQNTSVDKEDEDILNLDEF